MKNFLFTISVVFLTISISMAQQKGVQTKTENGTIEGFHDTKTDLDMYFGIPFAKPPVGELRWKAPQPVVSWKGVKETKSFGPSPVQTNVFGDMVYRSDSVSEDCLYLNVWVPANSKNKKLPVLVYFYGGGFVAGDGSEPRYDGASLAQKGMVTVTANYRLNIFGFFAHPELSAEAPYHASGNYGLLDQVAALKWVNKNIAAFGGDPDHVTIAGESAGSISVSAQMASPLSKDLFAGAIGESGAAIKPTLFPIPLSEAEQAGQEFEQKVGLHTLKELRALSTDSVFSLYSHSGRFGFSTVIDGYFYPKSLPEIFGAGEQAQVPLLVGWNSAEIPGEAFMQGQPYTEENYIQKVKEAFPNDYEKVLTLYSHGSPKEIKESATALAADRFIAYSTWKWFDLHRKNSSQPVYRYLFSRIRPSVKTPEMEAESGDSAGNKEETPTMPEPIGAPHASEIPYCMGNLHLIKTFPWTEDDYTVSRTMEDYFANFILTGDPNGEGLPEWPVAKGDDTTPPVMILNVESKAIEAGNDDRYRFLDSFYGNK